MYNLRSCFQSMRSIYIIHGSTTLWPYFKECACVRARTYVYVGYSLALSQTPSCKQMGSGNLQHESCSWNIIKCIKILASLNDV